MEAADRWDVRTNVPPGTRGLHHQVHLQPRLEVPNTHAYDGASLLATLSADSTAKLWESASIWRHADEPSPGSTGGSPAPSIASSIAPVQILAGHTRWVWDGAFSADSAYLVTGASDGTARLWDIARAETVCIYVGHQKAITAIAMNDLTGTPEA